ncbi:POM121-like protein 12 isoform X2 [Callorhinus ursinus]|uniref:POM121-like protein 12 n=1 Tax=Callorhinus ursinus TaxID=34884 RepID=A0A3Q7MPJ7_CALUR|nr:POM121-like protein 12 [Callorhinus ursinus]
MGNYLSTPKAEPPPLAQRRGNPRPRPAQAEDGGHRIRSGPLPQMPPNWDPARQRRVVTEAWRRFPAKPPAETVLGPDLSGAWESYMKRVCREDADLEPDAQPSLSATHPTAGAVSAQGPDPQLQSLEKMQHSRGLPPSYRA